MQEEQERIMVEVDPAAVELLTDEKYRAGFEQWSPQPRSLGGFRLALRTAADWSSERSAVYRIFLRETDARELHRWCEEHAEILITFPAESDRNNGQVLKRAARDIAEGLRLSRPDSPAGTIVGIVSG